MSRGDDNSLPFATSRTRVLNLRARWSWIQPIVQMPRIRKLLHRCLRHWMRVRETEFLRHYPDRLQTVLDGWFRYDPKQPPFTYGMGVEWLNQRMPRPDSIEWFQVHHACHYIAEWAVEVAQVHMPHLRWEIRRSSLHTTVIGFLHTGEIRWLFDVLFFEKLTARQILAWTRQLNPVAPVLRSGRRTRTGSKQLTCLIVPDSASLQLQDATRRSRVTRC